MKIKMLLTTVLITAASFAARAGGVVGFSVGIPAPVVVAAPVPAVVAPAPVVVAGYLPGRVWVPGYWSACGYSRVWVPGCWHYRPGYRCYPRGGWRW